MPTEYRIREKSIERWWREQLKKLGFEVLKFSSYYSTGWPDRFALSPWGVLYLAEFKAPGKKPTPKQEARINSAMKKGYKVFVIDSKESAKASVEYLQMAKDLYA